jgi:hypothetical protein
MSSASRHRQQRLEARLRVPCGRRRHSRIHGLDCPRPRRSACPRRVLLIWWAATNPSPHRPEDVVVLLPRLMTDAGAAVSSLLCAPFGFKCTECDLYRGREAGDLDKWAADGGSGERDEGRFPVASATPTGDGVDAGGLMVSEIVVGGLVGVALRSCRGRRSPWPSSNTRPRPRGIARRTSTPRRPRNQASDIATARVRCTNRD